MIPKQFRIPVILQIAIFFIPMNIYVIGDWIGTGIQWVFFRYVQAQITQESIVRTITSIIPLSREVGLIISGQLVGRSALASILWATGTILVTIAFIVLLSGAFKKDSLFICKASLINAGSILFFILSIITQYGVLFHGPAGIAIPIGIPVFAVITFWEYRFASVSPAESGIAEDPI